MPSVSDYTQGQWRQYAAKLEEYASGSTVGDACNLDYGTCRYCTYSEPGLNLPAYEMFGVLEELTQIAQDLSEYYIYGRRGRTEVRVKAAAELAAFIRKEICMHNNGCPPRACWTRIGSMRRWPILLIFGVAAIAGCLMNMLRSA